MLPKQIKNKLMDLYNHEFDFSTIDDYYGDSHIFEIYICKKCKFKVFKRFYLNLSGDNCIYALHNDLIWKLEDKQILTCEENTIKNLLE